MKCPTCGAKAHATGQPGAYVIPYVCDNGHRGVYVPPAEPDYASFVPYDGGSY